MSNPEEFWDRMAGQFDTGGEDNGPTAIKMIEFVQRHLQESDRVLDYGCATGNIALRIARQVQAVHGIDISGNMIAAAEEKAAEGGVLNVSFAQATVFDERLAAGSFDAVLALNILHLLGETGAALKRLHALLKPGGRLLSATACLGERRFSMTSLSLRLAGKVGVAPAVHFFKTAGLEETICTAGFQLLECESLLDKPSKTIVHFVAADKAGAPAFE